MGAYALLCACIAAWVLVNAKETVKDWQERTPSAQAIIKNVYLASAGTAANTAAGEKGGRDQTYVAIIVSGLGLSAAPTEQALNDLPRGISLAFSPYSDGLDKWLDKAKDTRRETLVFLPMETSIFPQHDPGPRALSSRLSDLDNDNNLKWVLNQGKESAGVINYMGSRFLADKKRLSGIFRTLQEKGNIFVEFPEEGASASAAAEIAAAASLPYLAVNMKIDGTVTEKAIRQKLALLEKMAWEHGYAVGIAEPYPLTLNTLKTWTAELPSRGIVLSSLSTLSKKNTDNAKK